jgi:hypothetical protein
MVFWTMKRLRDKTSVEGFWDISTSVEAIVALVVQSNQANRFFKLKNMVIVGTGNIVQLTGL